MRKPMRRLSRLLGWDSNPLRRRSDHVEKWLLTGLIALFLIGAPMAAIVAGQHAAASALRQQDTQRPWHEVAATVLQDASAEVGPYYGWGMTLVPVRWMTSAGSQRTGMVATQLSVQAGSHLSVWVNSSGGLTDAPLTHAQVVQRELVAAITAPVVLALVLFLGGAAGRLLLDRRRLAASERAWYAVGPRWTRLR